MSRRVPNILTNYT